MAASFDGETLALLDGARRVRIETVRPDGSARRTTIWVVVEGGAVFVRSVRGERGYWYHAALDNPDRVALIARGRTIPVRAVAAADADSIERCSRGLAAKYADDLSTPSMLRSVVLGTTLRLDPR